MNLNEALFNLLDIIRNTMIQKIKISEVNLSAMNLKLLKIISTMENCTGQKLADFMGRDKAQINRLIKELFNQELLIKQSNENDKRSQLITLTTKGEALVLQFNNIEHEVFQAMSVGIPPEQIENFIVLAKKFKSNLNGQAK